MKTHLPVAASLLALSVLCLAPGPGARSAPDPCPGPIFEDKDHTLRRPESYREWFFVGSSLGLSYAERPGPRPEAGQQTFHNVYIDPVAYRAFARTGAFPEGTMMALEQATAAEKREP